MEKIIRKNWLMTFAVILISCFVLTSCGNDDNNDGPDEPGTNIPETATYEDLIIGEWEFDNDDETRIFFRANGTGYDKIFWNGEWDKDETFEWEIKGTKLYLDYYGEDYVTFTIVSLTTKKLKIKAYDEEEDEYYTLTLSKV